MALTISLIVYSEASYSNPSKLRCSMRGRPSALWRVWCVMEYETTPIPSSWAICVMMAVLPMPGAPTRKIGRCRDESMTYMPASSRCRYASIVSLICSFAAAMFIMSVVLPKALYILLLNRSIPSSSIITFMAQGGTDGVWCAPVSMKMKAVS